MGAEGSRSSFQLEKGLRNWLYGLAKAWNPADVSKDQMLASATQESLDAAIGASAAKQEAMPTRIALVSCVKTKRKATVAAKDLYISQLFKGMRNYAEQNADSWFILSAKYGLLRHDQAIAPYELTLKAMPKRDRLAWAERVQCQLLEFLPAGALVVILAGHYYQKDLVPFLKSHGFTVEAPMVGLGFGSRLRWLKEQMCDEQARR